MKNSSSVDIQTIRILYKKYKEHILYIGVMIVSFLIVILFTIPKFTQLSAINQERKEEERKLEVLKSNSGILQNSTEKNLDNQLKVVSSALPEGKDFEGVLNAITVASAKSGVFLKDYEFDVGALSESASPEKGYPLISLNLDVSASQDQLITLLRNLSETVPLSEVISIKGSPSNTTIEMVFYYKSSAPADGFSDTTKLKNLDHEDLQMIDKISSWQSSLPEIGQNFPSSTDSSTTAPF